MFILEHYIVDRVKVWIVLKILPFHSIDWCDHGMVLLVVLGLGHIASLTNWKQDFVYVVAPGALTLGDPDSGCAVCSNMSWVCGFPTLVTFLRPER